MGNALLKAKADRIYIPPREKSQVVKARPAEGFYDVQLKKSLAVAFGRYEKALEDLSKV